MAKINVVIDYSHINWVLGGLFREVIQADPKSYSRMIVISPIRSRYVFMSLIRVYFLIPKKNIILFSSLTPFENFLKLKPFSKSKKIVWFTHSEEKPTNRVISKLNQASIILCQSNREKNNLKNLGVNVPIIPFMGAIDPSRFKLAPLKGSKIVIVGTAANRKNPHIILALAEKYPELNFKIIGKNWSNDTSLFRALFNFKNIEYIEIKGPVRSSDFDYCSHYLMVSTIEGGPISLIEAVASGLIPICTNTGIVEEFLELIGYENQIIQSPVSLDEIIVKYKNKYTKSQIESATRIAKSFTITRLSKIFKYQALTENEFN